MSIIFNHWFEDESANITKGDLNQLEHENEKLREKAEKYDKLKEAIIKSKKEIAASIETEEKKSGKTSYFDGLTEAKYILNYYTEGLI